MTAGEFIIVRPVNLSEAELFRLLADSVYVARLSNGQRVRDVGDFREWLLELARAAAKEGEILGEDCRCYICTHGGRCDNPGALGHGAKNGDGQ